MCVLGKCDGVLRSSLFLPIFALVRAESLQYLKKRHAYKMFHLDVIYNVKISISFRQIHELAVWLKP